MERAPNKPDAVNPAITLRFAIEDQWRRVTDLERQALLRVINEREENNLYEHD